MGTPQSAALQLDPPAWPLGAGLEAPEIAAALARLRLDPDVQEIRLFGSRARGEARPSSDLDLLISDAATTSHWAGSRWHVLGHIHR